MLIFLLGMSGLECLCAGLPPSIPARPPEAKPGSLIFDEVRHLPLDERESRILKELLSGNLPEFYRHFVPISYTNTIRGNAHVIRCNVAPDYLCVGSDTDYVLIPLSPGTARSVARAWGCSLPTPGMVDAIFTAAGLKLLPAPIPPDKEMTTVPVFSLHDSMIRTQRFDALASFPLGSLVAGHKKDVVQTIRLEANPGKVAIYGWHGTNGKPIQPLYLGHTDRWVDYSHGIRLVDDQVFVDGKPVSLSAALHSPSQAAILGDTSTFASPYTLRDSFGEKNERFFLAPDVRVVINRPATNLLDAGKMAKVILFALPNGNSIEQTAGRKIKPGDEDRFSYQHIAAQMRFLRESDTNSVWTLAYLEAEGMSWPSWKKARPNGPKLIVSLVQSVLERVGRRTDWVELNCHSGGGSFLFGYLDGVESIPDTIKRISFMDATYGYESAAQHGQKLTEWLQRSSDKFLSVLAYEDYKGLLNGKSFISEKGGTWSRSKMMMEDLSTAFMFDHKVNGLWHEYRSLSGRAVFLLRENPEKKIWHTVMVERNGFIHTTLSGTTFENRGYSFFGQNAYEKWIENP